MNHKTFMSLLEKNRGDIIRTIKAEVLNSFMPDFYGTYEIYLNEEDGQIWVLQVDYDKTYSKGNTTIHYLYDIPSHAIREGDFTAWLTREGFQLPKKPNENRLKQIYKEQYQNFSDEICAYAMTEMIEAEHTFQKIYDLYKKNKNVTCDDISGLRWRA